MSILEHAAHRPTNPNATTPLLSLAADLLPSVRPSVPLLPQPPLTLTACPITLLSCTYNVGEANRRGSQVREQGYWSKGGGY